MSYDDLWPDGDEDVTWGDLLWVLLLLVALWLAGLGGQR